MRYILSCPCPYEPPYDYPHPHPSSSYFFVCNIRYFWFIERLFHAWVGVSFSKFKETFSSFDSTFPFARLVAGRRCRCCTGSSDCIPHSLHFWNSNERVRKKERVLLDRKIRAYFEATSMLNSFSCFWNEHSSVTREFNRLNSSTEFFMRSMLAMILGGAAPRASSSCWHVQVED